MENYLLAQFSHLYILTEILSAQNMQFCLFFCQGLWSIVDIGERPESMTIPGVPHVSFLFYKIKSSGRFPERVLKVN